MKSKALLIAGIAAASVLAGGLALAQSSGQGPGGFGPPFMRGEGWGMGPGMGPYGGRGMLSGMGPGMHRWGGGMGPGMMQGGPGMYGGRGWGFGGSAWIDGLKSELGITAAQEPAWTKYVKAVEDTATAARTTRDTVDPDALNKMSPQERFAYMTKLREQRWKQHEGVLTAATELLAVLDDKQKATAEETLPGLAFGPGSMGGFAMGGPHRWYRGR
jgi:hypothetical protein